MTLLLKSYFAGLIQTTGADHVVLIRDAAATSSCPPPVSPKTEEKKTRPSFNSFSDLQCPPPSCPSRQVSIDGLNVMPDQRMSRKNKNSGSNKKHSLKDFSAEVAPKLSTLSTFHKMEVGGDHTRNDFSPMSISNKMRGGSSQKKNIRTMIEILDEVEDLLDIGQPDDERVRDRGVSPITSLHKRQVLAPPIQRSSWSTVI
jgi:hypothetical protein